jgi:hypothetical protein
MELQFYRWKLPHFPDGLQDPLRSWAGCRVGGVGHWPNKSQDPLWTLPSKNGNSIIFLAHKQLREGMTPFYR